MKILGKKEEKKTCKKKKNKKNIGKAPTRFRILH
jgi:hypothetical protein